MVGFITEGTHGDLNRRDRFQVQVDEIAIARVVQCSAADQVRRWYVL